MLATDGTGRLCLDFDTTQEWMLYFLLAYIRDEPIDDHVEAFDAAHARATGRFETPDALLAHLVQTATTRVQRKQAEVNQRRWQRFKENHKHQSKYQVLRAIAFFLRYTPTDEATMLDEQGGAQ